MVKHGGGQDLWHIIETLCHRYRVYVLTYDDPVKPVPESALSPYVANLHVIRYAITTVDKLVISLVAVHQGFRFSMPRRIWEMRQFIADWCIRYEIDILHCGWTEMGMFLNASDRSMVRVLDEVDVRFRVDEQAVANGTIDINTAGERKAKELDYCRQADFVITRSHADRNALLSISPDMDVLVMPPVAHAAQLLSTSLTIPTEHQVLFVGAISREANQRALRWFVQLVWPLVRANSPQATFLIVGSDPPPDIVDLTAIAGVQVLSNVPDVCVYYYNARVVVAPMLTPSGQLNKIIDGLAAGRPVVATTLANRGTAAPCVLIADTPAAFSDGVVKLLTDDVWWQTMAADSRAYANAHFHWSTYELETTYEKYLLNGQQIK